jgi:multidrug efflux system membrane fusion protein
MTRLLLHLSLVLAVLVCGCQPKRRAVASAEAPAVPISHPVPREVTDYVDFTGRTDAVEAVDVRARVTGYLVKIPFKEGAEIKKGDLLFQIDSRPYEAQLEQAQGQVKLYEASLRLAKTTYSRDRAIALSVAGGVSQQQLDQDKAAVEEAEARVNAYKASVKVYQLNLDFTHVTSPIAGKVSRYYLTTGNLVLQDQTLLTTVVSLDPMHVYFDMDEPTLLRIRRAVNEGKIKRPSAGVIPVLMSLQGEEGFPHKGTVNFVNNQVNPSTGSISVRGVFPNAIGPGGVRLLTPGMFVRVRFPIGQPHSALLVIDRAIGSDQGLKYVYVVDKENKIQTRRVRTGALQEDGLRVIEGDKPGEGVQPDDWVVVGALPQIRPRMEVRTEMVPMPTLTQAESARVLPPKK